MRANTMNTGRHQNRREDAIGGSTQRHVQELASKVITESLEDRMAKRQRLQQAVELDSDSDEEKKHGAEGYYYFTP